METPFSEGSKLILIINQEFVYIEKIPKFRAWTGGLAGI